MTERLAQILVHNGVEVFEASGPVRVGDRGPSRPREPTSYP